MAWNAADYAKHSSEQQRWARELIAKLALRGDERVLDIGCGDGKVTAELAASVPRGSVVGIDSSPEMIRFARAIILPVVGNLRFELMDAREITFRNEFDVVFSNAALHWIFDHGPVLTGIAAALRRGGRVLLQMGGKGNAAEILQTVTAVSHREQWKPFFRDFDFRYGFHDPDDYRRWMGDAGLRATRAELIAKDMVHADAAALAGWVRTTWIPWTGLVPAERREAFIDEIVQAYLAKHPADAQGRCHVAMVRLEVEAVREP